MSLRKTSHSDKIPRGFHKSEFERDKARLELMHIFLVYYEVWRKTWIQTNNYKLFYEKPINIFNNHSWIFYFEIFRLLCCKRLHYLESNSICIV